MRLPVCYSIFLSRLAICLLPNEIDDLPSSQHGKRPAFAQIRWSTWCLPNKVSDFPSGLELELGPALL
jgi:hypothetical protein